MPRNKGLLIVVSGPSGVGKGTVCKKYLEDYDNTFISVSATTRAPRPGEIDGTHYHFLKKEQFESMIAEDGFIEWACFCENYYGTPKKAVCDMLEEGKDVILEIEVQGAMKVAEQFPDAVLVFVFPPSMEELRNRLRGRQTETEEVIKKRLETAKWEISMSENYDYILVNDEVLSATRRLKNIVDSEKQSVKRNAEYIKNFIK